MIKNRTFSILITRFYIRSFDRRTLPAHWHVCEKFLSPRIEWELNYLLFNQTYQPSRGHRVVFVCVPARALEVDLEDRIFKLTQFIYRRFCRCVLFSL